LLAANLRIQVLLGSQMAETGFVKRRGAAGAASLRFLAGGPALSTIHLRFHADPSANL
jgi:hypothetical protein